jgi:EAL domain-containing protein (putative c-di-GMP-specific phosphodiesterase class I)
MDDFGTGYSSLSYLQSFPFDKIKIDQSFISKLKSNPHSAAIVRAVIGLAHGLNLPVLAEGVETKAQLEFLAVESCDEVQGYLMGAATSNLGIFETHRPRRRGGDKAVHRLNIPIYFRRRRCWPSPIFLASCERATA